MRALPPVEGSGRGPRPGRPPRRARSSPPPLRPDQSRVGRRRVSWVSVSAAGGRPAWQGLGQRGAVASAGRDSDGRGRPAGKWINVHLDRGRAVTGAEVKTYLLEKARVVQQAADERNYHVFYQVWACLSVGRSELPACLPASLPARESAIPSACPPVGPPVDASSAVSPSPSSSPLHQL